MEDKLISIGDAAQLLGVSIDTLRRWDKLGKLVSVRVPSGHRRYKKSDIQLFMQNISALANEWAFLNEGTVPQSKFYCPTSAVFQARLESMQTFFARQENLKDIFPLLISITGEIGNNSFDHNLGNWPDAPGIFFGYDFNKRIIVLADRGQGILTTLRRVRPALSNDEDAIRTAFTEIITGRAPESRGNGLKFVRKVVENFNINLNFQTGSGQLELKHANPVLFIKKVSRKLRGCIAYIYF